MYSTLSFKTRFCFQSAETPVLKHRLYYIYTPHTIDYIIYNVVFWGPMTRWVSPVGLLFTSVVVKNHPEVMESELRNGF